MIELLAAFVLGPAVLVIADFLDRGPANGSGTVPALSAAIEGLCATSFVGLAVLGAALGVCTRAPVWQLALASVLVFPLLVIPDYIADPTSHNLLPFELGLYAVLAFVVGAGAVSGRGMRALAQR